MSLTEHQLRLLVTIPNNETQPDDGLKLPEQTDYLAAAGLRSEGLVKFHNLTWTRTQAGDVAVGRLLRHLNEWITGDETS